ncbi:MAG: cation transporter [Oscillospiraceae bacterium]
MKKSFKLAQLDCANCAAKMEAAINKIDGVNSASISFMLQKLTVDANDADFDSIMEKAKNICAKIEPDCKVEL